MKIVFSLFALWLPVIFIYGQFLDNPLVFDDFNFFKEANRGRFSDLSMILHLRWIAYGSFQWPPALFGSDLVWQRVENLALHLITSTILFLFLRRLFERILPVRNASNKTLSAHWLALFGALIFALHPVSVYAVAYLVQRSILMATLFAVLTWGLFFEGLIRTNRRWMFASVVTYVLAVFSKEHAVMVPAISATLLLLVDDKPIYERIKLAWPTFVFYGLTAVYMILKIHSEHPLGQIYEQRAATLIPMLGKDFDGHLIYPLSILTQSFLFFKYLWIWVVPSPAWMSVDMPQAFALQLWSWPQIAGLIGFVIYPVIAARLLLFKKGINGLLGFALLCPWLLFATELATVRIQEPFVLYRSYLWMVGAFAALPVLCQKLNARQAVITLTCISVLMMLLSWMRLQTFSHPLLLWDDAAQLIDEEDEKYLGVDRIFYNRGTELMNLKHFDEAFKDLTKAIELKGYHADLAYFNRRYVFMQSKQYLRALSDSNKSIELSPQKAAFYVGKGHVLEKLKDSTGA
ncbi:MAG: tetratricopeptide repeat protein, partial [Methylobacter sp.]